MSPKFKRQWRPSLFKLMLMVQLLLLISSVFAITSSGRTLPVTQFASSEKPAPAPEVDPMEPCYLSNNRASESLTISESTPVGTVVGEIMVNGDSSTNGNIELSIKMPGGANQAHAYQHSAAAGISLPLSRRTLDTGTHHPTTTSTVESVQQRQSQSATKHLNDLIDLMPPLSIEQETKRLILAKKLDRENLDRYILAGGYQSHSSAAGNSLAQSSSASLTVHVKCQLRIQKLMVNNSNNTSEQQQQQQTKISNSTNNSYFNVNQPGYVKTTASRHHSSSSILIPIHLIVTDDNDNWPVFINAPYIIDLNESVPIGSPLPGNEIVAVDDDQQGPLSTIEYSIVPGSLWSDSFGFLNPLDARSLIVKNNRLLDYESQSKLTLKVMARDQGEPANWAIASLYINLFDTDDQGPVFAEDKYLGYVRDNRPGEEVDLVPARLSARDADRTLNAPIVYSFHLKTNHSVHFDLDPELGRVSLRKSLPENQRQPFCLLIRATQADNPLRWTMTALNVRLATRPNLELQQRPSVASSTAPSRLHHLLNGGGADVGLRVVDSSGASGDDHKLTTIAFAQSNHSVEVPEAARPGFVVFRARDELMIGSSFAQVAFYLLDDEAGHFNLDQKSGLLLLNKSIDYELHRHLSIRILVTGEQSDSSGFNALPRLVCDITRINIQVLPLNEFAPEFSHEQYNFQLSVSDLIANFDQQQQQQQQHSSGAKDESGKKLPIKRFGNSDLVTEDLASLVEMHQLDIFEQQVKSRSMLLGQIHCADRDHGDKVSLKLMGTKANLFQLTQDGRLYLPLSNITSGQLETLSRTKYGNRLFGHTRVQKYGNLATEEQTQAAAIDRSYLNHLLAEFSNLGRLRLKVQASDDGQPTPKQTIALIVITIISIDNFILQRAPQVSNSWSPKSSSPLDDSFAIKLTNETSYDTSRSIASTTVSTNDLDKAAASNVGQMQQVMMIPATNGRSFVQINPDIFTNLMSQSSPTTSEQATNSSSPSVVSPPNALHGNQMNKLGANRSQPPSLLVVDDDGAKFVAMPAAIELYNQQVQEASDIQSKQQRGNHTQSDQRELSDKDRSASLWSQWKTYMGLSSASSSTSSFGALFWLNLSTALLLHLAALAVIISLVQSLRSAAASHFGNGDGSSSLWTRCLWPADLLRRSRRLSNRSHHNRSVARSIIDQAAASYASASAASGLNSHSGSSGSTDCSDASSGFGFASSKRMSDGHFHRSVAGKLSPSRRQQVVSCGVVVSAMANGYQQQPHPDSAHDAGKQNLMGHLRVTLNKMLDVRSSDTSDNRTTDKLLTIGSSNRSPVGAASKHEPKHTNDEKQSPSISTNNCNNRSTSTFLSRPQQQQHQQQQHKSTKSSAEDATATVSINVTKPNEIHERKSKLTGSQSSSVVSLVSMSSSSISNKISAAVERTQNTIASEVSSLDSATLFSNSSVDTDPARKQAPPPPPPPPPPPCLVQVSNKGPKVMTKSGRLQRETGEQQVLKVEYTNDKPAAACKSSDSKPFSSRPQIENLTASTSTSITQQIRRPLPQNPLHVKLKQQAAAIASQQKTGVCNATSAKSGDMRCHLDAPSMESPTLSGQGAKTVSPTTSVDRGYESFQSYVSSSQANSKSNTNEQHQQQQLGSSDSDLSQQSSRSSSSALVKSRHLPPVPSKATGRSAAIPLNQRIHKGGPTRDESLLRVVKSQDSFRVRRASQTLATGAQAANVLRGRLAAATKQQQQHASGRSLASGQGEGGIKLSANRARPLNDKSGRQSAGQVPARGCSNGGDTEDEDFYYCYDQTADSDYKLSVDPSGRRQRSHKAACKTTTAKDLALMDEYVSHAYLHERDKQRDDEQLDCSIAEGIIRDLDNCPTNQVIQQRQQESLLLATPQTNISNRLLVTPSQSGAEADLVMTTTGTHHYCAQDSSNSDLVSSPSRLRKHKSSHHHHHHHHHQQRHPTSRGANLVSCPKKQLTWSDQVEIG